MAGEIQCDLGPANTGITAYAMLRDVSGQVYNTAGSAFEAFNASNITDYDIALTEQGATGYFTGSMPSVAAGVYTVTIKQRAGVAPAVSDNSIGGGEIQWSGTAVVTLASIASNTGTGARTVTLTVNDGTTALEGASVRMIKGAENYVGTTNASGQIVFSLDDGTWSVAISLAGYTFTPTTLAVSATTSHTYSMTAVTLTPSSPGLTTGYLTCYSKLGVAQSGVSVIVSVAEEGDADGSAYPDTVRTATSDTNGLVEFTNMHKGLTYRIQRGSTAAKAYTFTIPTSAGSTYELPTIIGD